MTKSFVANIPLFDASELSEFRRRLINKGKTLDEETRTRERLDFVKRVQAPKDEFMSWFRTRFPLGDPHEVTCSIPERMPLSEGELAAPPKYTEMSLWEVLMDIPPKQAALPAFWASYNIELLQRGIIEDPTHFAKPIGSGAASTGREALERASAGDHKELDRCTRTLCRQMLGGVPEERGQVSVYIDPRIARAWWRGHIVRQTQEDLNIDADEIWETLRQAGAPWEELIQHMVRKLTHIGERPIRSALVARLVEMKEQLNDDSKTRRERTVALLAAVGRRSARQSLGILDAHEVLEVLREIGEPT